MLLIKQNAKRLLLLALLVLLLLPAGQAKYEWMDTGKLAGFYETAAPHPELTWDSFMTSTYQPALERYLDEQLGFRTWLIKARNQLSFSLLHESDNPNLYVGRNNSLFDARTLYGYTGLDAADEKTVQRHIHRLRVVQDTLARRGKLLVFVAAASKASFAPENLPPYFRRFPRKKSNYENYTAAMRHAGINLVDLSKVVRSWKDTATYPLFPRYGGHWSNYAAALAGDTLMRYIEKKSGYNLRDYHLFAGDVSNQPRDNDTDTEKPLNLWSPLALYDMRYPRVEYEPLEPGQYRPNVLIMGDSFVFTVLYTYFAQAFDDRLSRYWLRNVLSETIVWPSDVPEGRDIMALDHKAQYLTRDIIVVMFTEYNMDQKLDYGFSDDAYRLFVPYTRADSLHMRALEHEIGQNARLADYWWARSAETGRSTAQLIHEAAMARYDSIR